MWSYNQQSRSKAVETTILNLSKDNPKYKNWSGFTEGLQCGLFLGSDFLSLPLLYVRGSWFQICNHKNNTHHHGTCDATSVRLHYSHQARWICTDNSNRSVTMSLLSAAPDVLNRCRNVCNNIWSFKLLCDSGGCLRFWKWEWCSWRFWRVWQHIIGFDELLLPE